MSLESGDVILIPYAPYTNYLVTKPRPCLVISSSQFNKTRPDVILAPITSNIRERDSTQVVLRSDESHFSQTGLRCSSAVKCGAIFTFSQRQVRRKLGVIHSDVLREVRQVLSRILIQD